MKTYRELLSEFIKLRDKYINLSYKERNNPEIGGVLLASIEEHHTKLKDLDKSMDTHYKK